MYGKYVGGKMLDFYLSINNSEEVIHIPVTPSEFTVSSSQGTETFETANYGWIKIIGNPELKTVSWSSFLPMTDYPYFCLLYTSGPTRTELANATNWTPVYDPKQIRIVEMRHKI